MRALIFAVGIGTVLVVSAFSKIRSRRRSRDVAAFAASLGFHFRADDPFGLLYDYNFPLFEMGNGRVCENVVWGEWKGMPFHETDYVFYEQGRTTRTFRPFSAVVVDVPAYLPNVTVERADLLSRVTGGAAWQDLQFESGEFNRAFIVRAGDPASAFKLIDAQMMHWMLSTEDAFGFQFYGSAILVWSRRLRPKDLLPLIGTAKELYDHIPRLIWADYGTGPTHTMGTGP
jgi:hypothetical protein